MFCTKCGNETMEGDAFCQYCGTPVRTAYPATPAIRSTMGVSISRPAVHPRPEPAPVVVPVAPVKRPWEELEAKVRDVMCERGHSVVFVISIVLFTLAMLFQLFDESGGLVETMAVMMDSMGVPREYWRELLYMDAGTRLIIKLISMLPMILTVIGLWLVFGGSFSRESTGTSNAGLVLMTVGEIIRLVTVCLVFTLIFGALMSACSALDGGGSFTRQARNVVLIAIFALAFVLVLMVLISGKTISTIGVVRRTLRIPSPNSDLSGFVAVMLMLIGTTSFMSLINGFSWNSLCLGLAYVMMGLQIFFYKTAMSELEEEISQYERKKSAPATIASRYAPAAPVAPGSYASDPMWKRVEQEDDYGNSY